MTVKPARVWLLTTASVFLAACGLQPTKPVDLSSRQSMWQAHQEQITDITGWRLNGKLGLRSPAESGSARLNWQQQYEHFNIHFSGPFGQGAAAISGTAQQAILELAGQDPMRTDKPGTALQQTLGWHIPIKALLHWVRGIPAPNHIAELELNDNGLLETLNQNNWQLSYHGYQAVDSLQLPRKIKLQRDDIRLTLIITQWSDITRATP